LDIVHLVERVNNKDGKEMASMCTGRPLTERTIPNAASIQFNLLMMSIYCSKHVHECNKYIVK
jgi:hypothetical protein